MKSKIKKVMLRSNDLVLKKYISILIIFIFFNCKIVLSQKGDNTISIFVAPGVSSTLSSKISDFDKTYFYVWSPYLNFTSEIVYKQLLNRQFSLNTGLGASFVSYELNHFNYYAAFENEHIENKLSCVNYKVPFFIKYNLKMFSAKGEINATFGAEINLIHAYSKSSMITAGSGNDSTLYINYEPYALNASIRLGFEYNNVFENKYLNFFTALVYQVRPFGEITILNSYTDLGEDINFSGHLYPKQISIYMGWHCAIFNNL